jgi:hypothetical protein
MLLRQVRATHNHYGVFAFQDGEVVMKSTPVMVALAAIVLTSLALIESAEARRYRSACGFPEYGYLAPYPFGGNDAPRVSFVPVVVHCTDHPFVVWKHCNVNSCW